MPLKQSVFAGNKLRVKRRRHFQTAFICCRIFPECQSSREGTLFRERGHISRSPACGFFAQICLPWSGRTYPVNPQSWYAFTISRMPVSPSQSRCEASEKSPLGKCFTFLICAKAILSQCFLTISATLFFGLELNEPGAECKAVIWVINHLEKAVNEKAHRQEDAEARRYPKAGHPDVSPA